MKNQIITMKVIKSGNTKPSHYWCYDNDVWWDDVPYDLAFHISHIINIEAQSKRKTRIHVNIFYPNRHTDYFIVNLGKKKVINILNGNEAWQNVDYVFTEVERVYETRIDCLNKRLEAA
jgi:hypothetical protein